MLRQPWNIPAPRRMSLGASQFHRGRGALLIPLLSRLRHERDPYTGFVDCAKRIAQEEGPTALYRAWWVTMLACIATAFST
jgi:hypothetical protein